MSTIAHGPPSLAEQAPVGGSPTVPRPATAFVEAEGLVEQIAHFVLRKRQFPDYPHEALVVGKYYVLDKIDEGAMGIVCTALERYFGVVALKIPKSVGDAHQRARVLAEGRLLAKVHHTNVLRVYEVGEWGGTLYIATEYVEGQTLRAWQSVTGRDWRSIVGAYLQAARGLQAIHACQIVHQDIKPENIRIDRDGTVRVLDFGLAHLETHAAHASTAPVVDPTRQTRPTFYRGGTPGYMAPEQYQSDQPIDARADQFAFCVALWEALYGELPYPAAAIASTVVGTPRRSLGPPRAGELRGAPRWLRAILLRGLAERPERRFSAMSGVIAAIERRLHRRWWPTLALGGLAGVSGAVIMALLSGPTLPMCVAPETSAAELLAAGRGPELAAAAGELRDPQAKRVWAAMQARLAAQRQRWLELHAAQCHRALAADDPGAVLTREPCFVARRDEMRLVADAMVSHARLHGSDPSGAWDEQRERWEAQLGSVDDCLGPQPSLATLLATHVEMDGPLRLARAAVLAGDPRAARPQFEQAVVAASRAGDRRRRAQARVELGRVELDLHANREAELHFLGAVRDADASGDDLTAADAESWLVHLIGTRADDPAMAQSWFERAMGRLERLGLDQSPRAFDVHFRAASAALRCGQAVAAERLLAQATALDQTLGPDELRLARLETQLARLAKLRGDRAASLDLARSALARFRRELGPESRSVAMALRDLGQYESEAGDTAAAERTLGLALVIFSRIVGPDSIDVATIHTELAQLYHYAGLPQYALYHAAASEPLARAGPIRHREFQIQQAAISGHLELDVTRRFERAAAHYRRGIALAEVPALTAEAASNRMLMAIALAKAELSRGRVREANTVMSSLLARLEQQSVDPEYAAYLALTAGEVALGVGESSEAASRARAALARLPEPTQNPTAEAAEMLWLLARALGPRDDEGRRAAQLAREMLRDANVASGCSFAVGTVERWLRSPR